MIPATLIPEKQPLIGFYERYDGDVYWCVSYQLPANFHGFVTVRLP